jgi:hypothetical protein
MAGIASAVVATRALKPKRPTGLHLNLRVAKLHAPSRDEIAKGLSSTGKHVGQAGRQLRDLAAEIQQAGETAERVGKVLSK